jgi:hypothetical protein
MKVRMRVKISGGRGDGTQWPDPGSVLETDKDEGAALCSAGLAVPVAEEPKTETAVPDRSGVETRTAESPVQAPEPAALVKPAVNAPKAAWVDYAAGHGYSRDDANAMNKADLITALGD